ncbi:MAG: hypothetical protein M3143_00280 [Actinomycetota bacterium]|nr:hypothetical protein [Actinomycetota bacterium]
MSSDDLLGRAIAMRAMGHIALKGMGDAWAQVADRWVEAQPPGIRKDVQELVDIKRDSTDVKARFAMGMGYHVPTPMEITGRNIDGLAAAADGPSE